MRWTDDQEYQRVPSLENFTNPTCEVDGGPRMPTGIWSQNYFKPYLRDRQIE